MTTEQKVSEKPEECECCHFDTKKLQFFPNQGAGDTSGGFWLCALCANTQAGNAVRYPRQYEGQLAILRTICYVGNALLRALK